ncbi:MAG: replicative DNA helicase [candidate division Zixibacteria bacterium]|nr:replicative DNA helicase [candidate division Zixibacteria bacterium]
MAVRSETARRDQHLTPPHSIEAERAVLGAVLRDENAMNQVVDIVPDPDYFYARKHQFVFRSMLALYEKGEPTDITTVVLKLQEVDKLDEIGGRVFLVELLEETPTAANVASYADTVLQKAILRRLISASTQIVEGCHRSGLPVEQLLDEAEANIFAISESRLRQGFVPIKGVITSTLEEIDDMQASEGGLSGLRTGYTEIDDKTLGLHRGDLIVIAGRPSMGKTALAMNIAENVATREKNPRKVGIFSIEMSKEALVFRLLCGRARLNQHKVRSGRITTAEWPRMAAAGNVLNNAPIFVDDSPSLSPLEIRAKARRLKAQHGLDLLIVDYIQLMHSSVRVENRQQEISLISRSLKSVAKELDVPVIAISQLSRAVEQRTGEKRPQLSDLRESGAIEQDADLVMLLYRPAYYQHRADPNDEKKPGFEELQNKAEVIIAKQRNGPTGTVNLVFIGELARFENPDRRHQELPQGVEPVESGPDMPF